MEEQLQEYSQTEGIRVSAINDIDQDVKNLSYLLKYDIIYGKFDKKINFISNNKISINNQIINFYSKNEIQKVPGQKITKFSY